jgi:hypothetical protein
MVARVNCLFILYACSSVLTLNSDLISDGHRAGAGGQGRGGALPRNVHGVCGAT